jgi:hypothetical protein
VNDRWVCKRCFADNESTDSACQRCGLIRGADATETDQTGWAQAASAGPPQQAGWQRWIRYWWIPVLVVVLAGGYLFGARRGDDGSLTSAGNVAIDDLRPGDCLNLGEELELADVDGVPCTEPHGFEVFELATWGGDGTYPPDSQVETIFLEACEPSFAAYVGEPWETSTIFADMITPTEAAWDEGARWVICLLYDPDNPQLTESLRGAGR